MRGFAAALVVVGHILDDAAQFGAHGIAAAGGWRVWGAGVDIFFVISGFIMIWTFGERFAAPRAASSFMIRRLTRIVPLYWLMTCVTALLLILAPSLFDRARFELGHFLLSLLFVPHTAPGGGDWPILGVGWTLNYEMAFYLIFAAGLWFRRSLGIAMITATIMLAFLMAQWLDRPDQAIVAFLANSVILEFLLGILLGLLLRRHGTDPRILIGAAVLALATGVALVVLLGGSRFALAGLPAFALLALALLLYPKQGGVLSSLVLTMGAASYALYLSHIPVINLLKAWLLASPTISSLPGGAAFALYALLAVILTPAVAILLFRYVERPAQELLRRREH